MFMDDLKSQRKIIESSLNYNFSVELYVMPAKEKR